jgi:hypothetical protein
VANADPKCSQLGIPKRLHRLNRPSVGVFKATELLFRRYNPTQITDPGLADAAVNFRHDGMSVNRSEFSERPDDVLFNTKQGGRHEDHKYLTFGLGYLTDFSWEHPCTKEKYSVKIEHDPETCMYPHTLVKLLKGKKVVEGIGSLANRIALKETFVSLCTIPE